MSEAVGRLKWVGRVSCEGGPMLATDPASFADWLGALPFAALQKRFPGDPRFANRRRTLHYWGQFSDQLPAPFTEDGGHAFHQFETEEQANAKLEELRAAILASKPGTQVSVDELSGRLLFVTPSGERMTAELSPASEYDAAWQSDEADEAWVHTVGKGHGVFFDLAGAGTAHVGVTAKGDEVVFVRSWLSGDDDTEAAEIDAVHAYVDAPRESEEIVGEISFAGEHLIAIWSTIARGQLFQTADQLLAALAGQETRELSTDSRRSVGTAVRIQPGRYRISISSTDREGDTDEDEDDRDEDDEDDEDEDERPWSCRWCRLVKIG